MKKRKIVVSTIVILILITIIVIVSAKGNDQVEQELYDPNVHQQLGWLNSTSRT